MKKYLAYFLTLMFLGFTLHSNSISATASDSQMFKPSSTFISLIEALKNNENIVVSQNGEDVTNYFRIFHENDFIEENYQAVFDSVRINEYVISDYRAPDGISQILLDSTRKDDYIDLNSHEATVKMYFYGEHYYLRTATQPPYTTIEFLVKFYTFARFHTITRNVVWADRPYLELVSGNLNGGVFANGSGNATRSISGSNVSYTSSWVVPVVSWSGMQGGYGYYITLAYPKVDFPTNPIVFTPWRWWDGSGTISSEGDDEQ